MATLQKTQATASRAKTPKAPAAEAAAGAMAPATDLIATRAYEIWLESGCPEGCEQEHWYRAERELRERMGR